MPSVGNRLLLRIRQKSDLTESGKAAAVKVCEVHHSNCVFSQWNSWLKISGTTTNHAGGAGALPCCFPKLMSELFPIWRHNSDLATLSDLVTLFRFGDSSDLATLFRFGDTLPESS